MSSVGVPITPQEPRAVAQIREAMLSLLAEGRTEEAVAYSLSALAAVLRKNTQLELLLAKLRRERIGTRSERMSAEQLALLLEELQQLCGPEPKADPLAEAADDAALDEEIERARAEAARTGSDPAHARGRVLRARDVERQVHQVELAPHERTCDICGCELRTIGADITRTLHYIPAHFVEHVHHLESMRAARARRA